MIYSLLGLRWGSCNRSKNFHRNMPVRVIFRLRKGKTMFSEGGDNTPLGLSLAESVIRRYSFDVEGDETIIQFVTRVLGFVVTADPHPHLNRMPSHIAVYVDYDVELNFDSMNGFRVFDENKAKGYEGQTLVVCYTSHN